MERFPENIIFKYTWRSYQQRVLDELSHHLKDRHLHVIAPPGSGKTVLGLEIALRINHPTLILAPTLAIRNQWIQRFCELFLQTNDKPEWISTNIRQPAFLTVSSYQGIHAAINSSKESKEKVINSLKELKIQTLILDEAHHLKREWWQTLTQVKNVLNPFVVGLTATPPFDVSASEWQRYIELNGPVDIEISIPELVLENDLCPHQDYIYCSFPTEHEFETLNNYRQQIEKFKSEILSDLVFVSVFQEHFFWKQPLQHLEWIYTNVNIYISALSFLKFKEIELNGEHLQIIDEDNFDQLPDFNDNALQVLLDFYLFKDVSVSEEILLHKEELLKKLKRLGVLELNRIQFSHQHKATKILTASSSKLNAIEQIVTFEYSLLKDKLRMVILTDFIRKEFFVQTEVNDLFLNKIGVATVFEQLRRINKNDLSLGILSGSLVVIPKAARVALDQIANLSLHYVPVSFDCNYLEIKTDEKSKTFIVQWITELFQKGFIKVLVGTKSLLGEGWDAPAINSMILASTAGSFVISNQMRGRAIRIQNDNPNKTSSIWHLACVDTSDQTGGKDFDSLKRRFKTFVGLSFEEIPVIINGIQRLNFPSNLLNRPEIEAKNEQMFLYAEKRNNLKELWQNALNKGTRLNEEIKVPFQSDKIYAKEKKLYFNKTLAYSLSILLLGLITFLMETIPNFIKSFTTFKSLKDIYTYFFFMFCSLILYFGKQTIITFKLYIRYRDISKDLKNISEVVLQSLIKAQVLTLNEKLEVATENDSNGAVYIYLKNGSAYEQSIFLQNIKELIDPIQNPRYIIVRKNKKMLFLHQKDFHAIPEIIGRNKELASFFYESWKTKVGSCDLVYTRTIEGRKKLLQARIKSLSSQLNSTTESMSKWN